MAETPDREEEQTAEPKPRRYNFDTLEEYLAAGERIAQDGRLDEAIDVLREATSTFPDSATAHYNLGVSIFLKLREDLAHLELWEDLADEEDLAEECLVEFQAAVDLDTELAPAWTNLGSILALRGRINEAIAAWEKSLSLDPNQPGVVSDIELYRARLLEEAEPKELSPKPENAEPDKEEEK